MSSTIAQWTLDVHDVAAMARFWSEVLGYRVEERPDGSAMLYPRQGDGAAELPVWLQPTEHPKRDKNRNHPDLRSRDGDVDAEVDRVVGLGARRIDVGQSPDDPFVVLADPEGNEFCILRGTP
ncbi:MAG TPA: VOC family protein [Segeticoccus sp.]|nr:VOC family protein [Segeticoccus sp.]